ncbi:MAG: methyl-accepting chemotaxis protein [Frankiaceae bacterium]|jgi:methyl-accepting chemotaxis protein|nr:methyl-accepting chemotaxis protein [Frankiaceae bacterium]
MCNGAGIRLPDSPLSEGAVKLFRASAADIVGALLLPSPRDGRHDTVDGVATTTPTREEVVAALPMQAAPAQPTPQPVDESLANPGPAVTLDYTHQLLRVAQLASVGVLLLISLAAVLSARYGAGGLVVHELPLAGWGLGMALSAVGLASLATDPTSGAVASARQRVGGTMLMVALLVSVSGVVASAGGVAGPAWVLAMPVVLLAGAVLGPLLGLSVGAAAAAGIYAAAGISHTLNYAGAGRLIVILPAVPAAGWAAGAFGRLAREAAVAAAERRAALEADVRRMSDVLAAVADGDLTRVPAPGDSADPVATSLAVVFADTLLALRRLVRQMDTVTGQLAGNSANLAATAEQHVTGVEAQSAAVAQTTSTIEELAATAGSIAEIAVRVSQFAGSTRLDVDSGARAVEETSLAMDRISARVEELADRAEGLRERIARVGLTTQAIDELARRTTILAVNASIEAARAGEHGHGFATVANEVNSLAERARTATARIAKIVAELEQGASDTASAGREGIAAVAIGSARHEDVVESLERIASMVDHTTQASREITNATRQQRGASDAVVSAMTSVTDASARHRSETHGHAAAASRLRDLADDLRATLSQFKVVS